MQRISILAAFFVVLCWSIVPTGYASAQQFDFTFWDYALLKNNPAEGALDPELKLNTIFKEQYSAGDMQLNSGFIGMAMPVYIGKASNQRSGVSAFIVQDGATGPGQYQQSEFSLGLSHAFFRKGITLAFGAGVLFHTQKMSISGLSTEQQFVEGLGFDPSLLSGETLEDFQESSFTFNAGTVYKKEAGEDLLYEMGLHLQNMGLQNQDLNNRPFGLNFYGKARLTHGPSGAIYGSLRQAFYKNNKSTQLGATFRFDLQNMQQKLLQKSESLDVIARYTISSHISTGLAVHFNTLTVGMLYDVNVHQNNSANNGGFELMLSFHKPKQRKKKVSKKQPVLQAQKPVEKTPIFASRETKPVTDQKREEEANSESALKEDTEEKPPVLDAETAATYGKFEHQYQNNGIQYAVFFDFDSDRIANADNAFIEKLADWLQSQPDASLVLNGHTDNRGSEVYNLSLSLRRAEAVKRALVANGVEEEKIVIKGIGEKEPLKANELQIGRKKNRRVDIVVQPSF